MRIIKFREAVVLISFLLVSVLANAQYCGNIPVGPLPTKCFEIENILVNACSSNEGYDEMVRLRIGPAPLRLNTINFVEWQTVNAWLGWATYNNSMQNKLNTINNAIAAAGNCGKLIRLNPTEFAPAYSRVLVITSTVFSTTAHDFTGLTDTLYVALQNNNSVASGHFSNTTVNEARRLIMRTSSCGDTVNYNGNQFVKADGTPGSEDGTGVDFAFNGTPTYINYGCAIKFNEVTVDAGTVGGPYCSGATVPLSGTATGTNCYFWYPANRAAGSFTDSTALNTNFVIANGFSGSIKLYLQAATGCNYKKDSVTFTVNLASGTITITPTTDTVRCNLNPVSLAATSTAANPVVWSTNGKGTFNSSSSLTPVYTPSTNDTISVWFTVTQNLSCGATRDSIRIRFTPKPSAKFTASDSVFCTSQAGTVITLVPQVAGGNFSGTGVSGNTFVVPSTPNTYTVQYVVSVNGCNDTYVKNFVVNSSTGAAFTLSDTIICFGTKNITVTPANTGGTFSGVTLAGNIFAPPAPGDYYITHKLGNGICKDSVTKHILVKPNPNAAFTASDTILCQGTGTALLTPANTGGTFSGTGVDNTTLLFTPTTLGINEVKYVLTQNGCADSTTKKIRVLTKPDASFTVTDTTLCINAGAVTLIPINAGGVFSGTGVSGNQFNPTTKGVFVVSYVLSNGTCQDSVTHSIRVDSLPDADFTVSDTVVCLDANAVILTPKVAGGNFNGELVSGTRFTPSKVGVFAVSYKLSNGGCTDSVVKYIRVAAKPSASFTFLPQKTMVNDTVKFTSTSSADVTSYLWRFDDGNTSTLQNPTHIYTKELTYLAWLIVGNGDGCLDSISNPIKVEADESIFVPNVFTPNNDSVNDRFVISHMGINNFTLNIYNRWGTHIFETNDPDITWDGKFLGEFCVEGVYVYLITYKNSKGLTRTLHGTVTLIR